MSSLIETRDHGSVREIRLARPPVNALNTELCRALIHAVDTAVGDGVRGIVLAGNPKIFSAGMDVPYLLSLGGNRPRAPTASASTKPRSAWSLRKASSG